MAQTRNDTAMQEPNQNTQTNRADEASEDTCSANDADDILQQTLDSTKTKASVPSTVIHITCHGSSKSESEKPVPPQFREGEPAEDLEGDVHSCGKCKLNFTKLEDYIAHKMNSKTCGMELNAAQKKIISHLGLPGMPKRGRGRPPGKKRPVQDNSYTPAGPVKNRVRGPYKKREVDISDLGVDHEPTGYTCSTCQRHFRREAALKRHIEYDHRKDSNDSESESDMEYVEPDELSEAEAETALAATSDMTTTEYVLLSDSTTVKSNDLHVETDGTLESQYQVIETLTFDTETGIYTTSSGAIVIQSGNELSLAKKSDDNTDPKQAQLLVQEVNAQGNIVKKADSDPDYEEISEPVKYLRSGGAKRILQLLNTKKKYKAFRMQKTGSEVKCHICGKILKDHAVLVAHLVTHSSDRPYLCKYPGCSYSFKTKGSLKRHTRRHTGERPFKCKICSRSFRESGALTRHLKARGFCAERSDREFPRYGKNLSLRGEITDEKEECTNSKNEESKSTHMYSLADQDHIPSPSVLDNMQTSDASLEGMKVIKVVRMQSESSQDLALAQAETNENVIEYSEEITEEDIEHLLSENEEDTSNVFTVGSEEEINTDPNFEVAEEKLTEIASEYILSHQVDEETEGPELTNSRTCSVDGLVFDSNEELMEHLRTHLIVNHTCDRCNYVTASTEKMDQHIKLTHLKQSYLPTIDSTELAGQVVEHHITAIDGISIKNEKQMKTWHDSENTNRAEEDQTDPGTTSENQTGDDDVKVANKALRQLMMLTDPQFNQTRSHSRLRTDCPVCGKNFKAHNYLRLHIKTHTGEKGFICKLCNKSFYTKDSLNKHHKFHSQERNYKCGECGKMFKRISHVKEHLRVHTSDRPYPCSLCMKTFKTVNACKVHMKTHIPLLQYKCNFCHKLFREKGSLDRHVRTHTGEKPYSCVHCGRKFAEHGTLNRHLKAKVPCTRDLQQVRLSQPVITTSNPTFIKLEAPQVVTMADSPQQQALMLAENQQLAEESSKAASSLGHEQQIQLHILPDDQMQEVSLVKEESTVLTEFSSVVADTQEYIIPTETKAGTEYITISSEGHEAVTLQEDSSQVQYILMEGTPTNNMFVLDEATGKHIQLLPSSADLAHLHILPQSDIQVMELSQGVCEEVTVHPELAHASEEVVVLETGQANHLEVASVESVQEIETVAEEQMEIS